MSSSRSEPESLKHTHIFDEGNPLGERRTRWAVMLTLLVMLLEIFGGIVFNSMALLADGWHMSSHALALGLSLLAYRAARYFSADSRFAFGTWKIEVLGGYTSAIFLVVIVGIMMYESVVRLLSPSPILYGQAIAVAAFGLVVNLICASLLHANGHHDHHHDHVGAGHSHHHDLNLRSAYIHVMTDAATSVLALVALFSGRYWGANWLDPVMGIVGAIVVTVWAFGLLRDSGRVLLDAEMDSPLAIEIRHGIERAAPAATITDLHLWRIGKKKYSCIISLCTAADLEPEDIKRILQPHTEFAHITVEVNSACMHRRG